MRVPNRVHTGGRVVARPGTSPLESLWAEAQTVQRVLTSLIALTGWKAMGAIAGLFGVIAPTVHALFEVIERQATEPH